LKENSDGVIDLLVEHHWAPYSYIPAGAGVVLAWLVR
jgi:hypothetical protein